MKRWNATRRLRRPSTSQPAPRGSGRTRGRWLWFAGLLCLVASISAPGQPPIIIDHTCTDLQRVPIAAIERAKATLRVAFGHTSHGSQIVSGMNALRKSQPALFGFGQGGGRDLFFLDRTPSGDLGNPDRRAWAQRTRELLNGSGKDLNVVLWSWCGQVSGASEKEIQLYLDLMNELETEFPSVRFVYMTGHLDGSGKEGNLHRRNEQIRAFCKTNNKILFDFADLESFDPDGRVNYMELHARDNCDYTEDGVVKNWADEWLKKNPGHGLALPSSAAHSRPLNGALKGRAFWWMLARLAGWNGEPAVHAKAAGKAGVQPPRVTSAGILIEKSVASAVHAPLPSP